MTCGVVGIYSRDKNVFLDIYQCLHALQHRGKESAGIAVSSRGNLKLKKGMGITADVFNEQDVSNMEGSLGIGHVRYSTQGGSSLTNAQPIAFHTGNGEISLAHNGDLVQARVLIPKFKREGSIFQTTSDTEIVAHNFAKSRGSNLQEIIEDSLRPVRDGAFSLVGLVKENGQREHKLFAARDIYGFRPLVLGMKDGEYVVSSETVAFDIIGANYIREIQPGEIIIFDSNGLQSFRPFKMVEEDKLLLCTFEAVYFSRPDGKIFGIPGWEVQQELGRLLGRKYKELSKEQGMKVDIVGPVPDSGNNAALGFSYETGIPLAFLFTRHHYIGRTFLAPEQEIREEEQRKKLNPYFGIADGKRIAVVDDSVIRATVAPQVNGMLRKDGATEVHLFSSFWPWKYPCRYGIDTPTKEELVAHGRESREIREKIGVNTLTYNDVEEVLGVINGLRLKCGLRKIGFCTACGTGDYKVVPSE